MNPVIRLQNVTKRYRDQRRSTTSRSRCRPGSSSPCWAKTARARPPPSASCSGWPSPTRARPKCWGSTRTQGDEIRRPRGLRARAADAVRMDDRRRDRLVHRRVLRRGYLPSYCELVRSSSCPKTQDQGALERDAGEGRAVAGHGPRAGAADSRRADLGPRPAGAPRVSRKHGRRGRRRAERCCCRAIRSAKSSAWPTSWPSSARASSSPSSGSTNSRLQIRELTLTFDQRHPRYLSDVPGEVICGREHDRQWRLLVRHWTKRVWTASGRWPRSATWRVRTPNLEEIFVGYMRSDEELVK